MKREIEGTRHHILPRSKGGSSYRRNILRLDKKLHEAHHLLYTNDTPTEQIITQLRKNASVLTSEFRQKILDIIEEYGDSAYRQGVKKKI
jgi:hypothetical protein